MRDLHLELGDASDVRDAVELGVERFHSFGLNLLLIHATGVEVADLLFVRALGRFPGAGRVLENLMQEFPVSLGQLVEAAPTGIRRRDGILGEPAPVRILVEVLARLAAWIHVGDFEAVDDRRHGRGSGGALLSSKKTTRGSTRYHEQSEEHERNKAVPETPTTHGLQTSLHRIVLVAHQEYSIAETGPREPFYVLGKSPRPFSSPAQHG